MLYVSRNPKRYLLHRQNLKAVVNCSIRLFSRTCLPTPTKEGQVKKLHSFSVRTVPDLTSKWFILLQLPAF